MKIKEQHIVSIKQEDDVFVYKHLMLSDSGNWYITGDNGSLVFVPLWQAQRLVEEVDAS